METHVLFLKKKECMELGELGKPQKTAGTKKQNWSKGSTQQNTTGGSTSLNVFSM